jgi:cytochrome c oxidase assembly factor CtaG
MSSLPFHVHPVMVVAIVGLFFLHRVLVADTIMRRRAFYALLALLVVVVWPIGDLAASVSVSVTTVQRLVIMLFCAPFLLRSLPMHLLVRCTRPTLFDAASRVIVQPVVAIVFVTVVGTLTLAPFAVDGGARSSLVRGVVLLVTLIVGVVLWLPVLSLLPGTRHLSLAGRGGYLFASSILVTTFSFAWIFSKHSLYPALHYQQQLIGMSALVDQQVAGFIAKLGAFGVMWAMGFRYFFKSDEEGVANEETPLHWADVERELLRVDRKRARAERRNGPT